MTAVYDVTVYAYEGGRLRLQPDAAVDGVSYDAAREIVMTLGPLFGRVQAAERGSRQVNGKWVKHVLSYVREDIPCIPARKHPYGEEECEAIFAAPA